MSSEEDIRYFTPGPVQMPAEICALGGRQVPYFRNEQFSRVVLDCERMLLELAGAKRGSRVILLTCSGTGAMEAAIANFCSRQDPALVINSQGFGQRLVDICDTLQRPCEEVRLPLAVAFKPEHVQDVPATKFSTVLCNAHDTMTGVRHDLPSLGEIARRNEALFLVDGISSFLCDPIGMDDWGVDVLMIGSQKALALPPGLAILILSPRAVEHVRSRRQDPGSYYFDLAAGLDNADRGQTPFTPAVGIVLQLQARLESLCRIGVDECVRRTGKLAEYFRKAIVAARLPFRVYPDIPSNGITALECMNPALKADELVRDLDESCGLYLTPNGGALRHSVFRVSHMGVQTEQALDNLVHALSDYVEKQGA